MSRFALLFTLSVALLTSGCGAPLSWNTGCGPPVVRECEPDAGVADAGRPTCTVAPGTSCVEPGASCLMGSDCHGPIRLTCQAAPTNCPVSRISYKRDIAYLTPEQLARMRDELLTLPLATYRYKADGPTARSHLGFMIDGHESLIAVDAAHDQVDLYSYASMAVAALKVQAEQIDRLEKEVAELKRERNPKRR